MGDREETARGAAADRDVKDLLHAAQAGHADAVVRLLERGVDVDARDRSRNTPLMIAAAQGRDEIVRILIERGADVNSRNSDGRTPLMAAAAYEPPEMVSHEIGDPSGTPGDASRSSGRGKTRKKRDIKAVVMTLLRAGADLHARDNSGRRALEIIRSNGRYYVEPLPTIGYLLQEAEKGIDRLERGGKWTAGQKIAYLLLLLGLFTVSLYAILSKLHK